MNRNVTSVFLTCACFLLACSLSVSNAATIVSKPFTAGRTAFFSQTAPAPSVRESADSFSLLEPTELTSLNWTGWYVTGATPPGTEFVIRFYSDSGGVPAAVASTELDVVTAPFDTGLNMDGGDVLSYSASFSVTLSPGAYWVAILEDDAATAAVNWAWGGAGLVSDSSVQRISTPTWTTYSNVGDRAFMLQGVPVPEPSTLALATTGIAGLLLAWRRRKRR